MQNLLARSLDAKLVSLFAMVATIPVITALILSSYSIHESSKQLLIGVITSGVVAFVFFISKSISKTIRDAARIAKEISQGNFAVMVSESNSSDEIGVLIRSQKQMIDSLKKVLNEVRAASQSVSASAQQLSASGTELNSSVQQISTTVDQVSRGSQSQAQRIEKSKQTVEELAKSMNQLSSSAKESAEVSNQVGLLSQRGAESAKEAGDYMNKIIEETNSSAQKVKALAEKTGEITAVLEVIRQIADQTSLLALNAAIEAARAGEAGRGFAVVADEVRRLAESSARSSDEIDSKLRQIQEHAQEVVQKIEFSTNEVNQGKMVIDSSLKILHEIVDNIKTVSESVRSLSDSAHEQLVKVNTISVDAAEIASVSEQNASATEEASAAVEQQTAQTHEISSAANQMSELAQQLNSTFAKFRLDLDESVPKTEQGKKSILAKIKLSK
jgi:methyl-accepting chemotaxis protein